jgi:hypothetical protein
MIGISGHPHVNLLTSVKQTWRSPAWLIGNLVSIRESASSVLSSLRALECMFPDGTWMVAQLDPGTKGIYKKCCHAGDALLPFALGWLRRRKPPSAPALFTAHPVPLSGFTSPNSRRTPPRHGRGVTGPPRPKSRLPSVASGTRLPEPRGPGNGRCSNAPHRSSSG